MSLHTNDSSITTTSSSSSTYIPYGTLDRHTNTRWALMGFLVLSPPVSAMFLIVHIRMERKKTNILNIQLALVNFLSSVILLPMFFSFYQLFSMNGEPFVSPWDENEYVNATFCGGLATTFYVLTSLHFTTLFALSLDRMVAVHLPFKYRRIANSYYICGLATLWTLTIIIPLLGFFVVVADDPIEISDNTIPRKLFEFLPHGLQVDQQVFCEITFPKIQIVTDPEFNSVPFEPNTRQKVYCFFIIVVPFVVVPLLTIIVGIITMFKIGVLDFKRKSLKYSKNEGGANLCGNFMTIMFKSQKIINPTNDVEMVYENRNHQAEEQVVRDMEAMAATLKKMPSKRRINTHFQALATVLMLMAFFCLCDALWWIFYVTHGFYYIFNKSVQSILNMFATRDQQVIFPIISRFGILIYSTFVPLLMIWRQKPLRDELLATLRIARSRVSDFTTSIFS